MITCEGSCTYRSSPLQRVFSATASACTPSSRLSARLSTCTAPTRSEAPSARSTRRLPGTRTRFTTRSRPTRLSRCCACCARSAAGWTPTPGARSRWRGAPDSSRGTSSSPASARRARSSSAAIALGRRHDQRRVGWRAGPHCGAGRAAGARGARGAARQSRHRRAQSSQHLHRD